MGIRRETEASFQSAVLQFARLNRWRVYHTADSRRSEEGFPDLVLVRNGRLVFAELKVGSNTTSTAQREWLEALSAVAEATGGTVGCYLWRPDSWDEIQTVLGGRS